jgi:HEAT repeat protein
MGAIYALGKIDDKRAIDSLVKTLSDKDKDMRDCAVETLDKLGWEPEND